MQACSLINLLNGSLSCLLVSESVPGFLLASMSQVAGVRPLRFKLPSHEPVGRRHHNGLGRLEFTNKCGQPLAPLALAQRLHGYAVVHMAAFARSHAIELRRVAAFDTAISLPARSRESVFANRTLRHLTRHDGVPCSRATAPRRIVFSDRIPRDARFSRRPSRGI